MLRVLNINSHSAIRVIPWLDPPGSLIAAGTQVDKRRQKETVIVCRIRGCFSWHRHIPHTCFFFLNGVVCHVPLFHLCCCYVGVYVPFEYVTISLIKCTLCLSWFISRISCIRTAKENGEEKRGEDTCKSWHNADFNPHEKKQPRPHLEAERGSSARAELRLGFTGPQAHAHFMRCWGLLRRKEGQIHKLRAAPVCTVAICGHLCPPVNITSLQTKCVISVFSLQHSHTVWVDKSISGLICSSPPSPCKIKESVPFLFMSVNLDQITPNPQENNSTQAKHSGKW